MCFPDGVLHQQVGRVHLRKMIGQEPGVEVFHQKWVGVCQKPVAAGVQVCHHLRNIGVADILRDLLLLVIQLITFFIRRPAILHAVATVEVPAVAAPVLHPQCSHRNVGSLKCCHFGEDLVATALGADPQAIGPLGGFGRSTDHIG